MADTDWPDTRDSISYIASQVYTHPTLIQQNFISAIRQPAHNSDTESLWTSELGLWFSTRAELTRRLSRRGVEYIESGVVKWTEKVMRRYLGRPPRVRSTRPAPDSNRVPKFSFLREHAEDHGQSDHDADTILVHKKIEQEAEDISLVYFQIVCLTYEEPSSRPDISDARKASRIINRLHDPKPFYDPPTYNALAAIDPFTLNQEPPVANAARLVMEHLRTRLAFLIGERRALVVEVHFIEMGRHAAAMSTIRDAILRPEVQEIKHAMYKIKGLLEEEIRMRMIMSDEIVTEAMAWDEVRAFACKTNSEAQYFLEALLDEWDEVWGPESAAWMDRQVEMGDVAGKPPLELESFELLAAAWWWIQDGEHRDSFRSDCEVQ